MWLAKWASNADPNLNPNPFTTSVPQITFHNLQIAFAQ